MVLLVPNIFLTANKLARAGLEDHFCGKLLGVPMGCDICYTNHADADQNDMDVLLTLFGAAGINFIMGIPGSRRCHAQLSNHFIP
ncbi:ethanolamine ammonia-lyase subunit EutB [Acinetobacter baumannii]